MPFEEWKTFVFCVLVLYSFFYFFMADTMGHGF